MAKFSDTGHEYLKGWNTQQCRWFFSIVKEHMDYCRIIFFFFTSLTMIPVWSGDLQNACSCWLVLFDLGFKLTAFKPRCFIIYVNYLYRQNLSGGMLGYPMILRDNCEIVVLLLLTIQRFKDGERAWRRGEEKNICRSAARFTAQPVVGDVWPRSKSCSVLYHAYL